VFYNPCEIMALTIGTQLGSHEITGLLGKGGMGEVYRARDTKLKRDVAIKVLPDEFSRDAARVSRFQREAEVLASLNHPNIAAIYDLEKENNTTFLVLELVEGETLADRIARGPIPVEEALDISKSICEALEAAHEKGIIHRDLKPANVKITPDRTVKVLDFGLAKMGGTPTVRRDESPTLTVGQTEAGVILGTASYMSPEQAKGKAVDQRADIYAFGAVLYEMLVGKRLHRGETTTEVLASVIKDEPRWDILPAQVQKLLRRCLEKDPQKRLRHIGDVMVLVDDVPAVPISMPTTAESGQHWVWPAVTAALAVALAVSGWNWWRATRLTDLPLVRQDVDLGVDIYLPPPVSFVSNVVISPDGTRIAYIARTASGGQQVLFTRRLDQPKAAQLPGTASALGPFFSPDGHWLGFAAGGKLYKMSVEGGAAVPLMDLSGAFGGASWSENDIVVAIRGRFLVRIPSGGGEATTLTEIAPGELFEVSPQILPGGKAVLFASNDRSDPDNGTIEVVSLVDHHRKAVLRGGSFPRYVASFSGGSQGHLLYTFKKALYAIPFDTGKLETHGTAVPVVDDLSGPVLVAGKFDVSQTGTLVYQKGSTGGGPATTTVQWRDSAGKQEPLLAREGIYTTARLSPDGKRLALAVREGANPDLLVYEWQSDRTIRLTFGGSTFGGFDASPVWSPDGRYVVFCSRDGNIFWTRADGSGQPQRLSQMQASSPQLPWSFSPDGKRLAYIEVSGGAQIWTISVEEQDGLLKGGMPEQFLKSQFLDTRASFSPDGKWLAYESNEAGMNEIYVRPFPPPASGQSGKWVISSQGGTFPVWSRTGHDLLYATPGGELMAVSYTVKSDTFIPDKPRVWLTRLGVRQFDLSPDGKRVAVVMPVRSEEAPNVEHEVVFIQNFFDELRRRVPANK
jgi:serine/threonine-protein kinase